jgi:predicted HD phosphohydrolase
MTAAEAAAYRRRPNLADVIQLRQLDDTGKLPEMQCPPLAFWLRIAREQLEAAAAANASTRSVRP